MIEEPNSLHLRQQQIEDDPGAENPRNGVRMSLDKREGGHGKLSRGWGYQSREGTEWPG